MFKSGETSTRPLTLAREGGKARNCREKTFSGSQREVCLGGSTGRAYLGESNDLEGWELILRKGYRYREPTQDDSGK